MSKGSFFKRCLISKACGHNGSSAQGFKDYSEDTRHEEEVFISCENIATERYLWGRFSNLHLVAELLQLTVRFQLQAYFKPRLSVRLAETDRSE